MERTSRRQVLLASAALATGVAGCPGRRDAPADSSPATTAATTKEREPTAATETTGSETTETTDPASSPHVAWTHEFESAVRATAVGSDLAFVGTKSGAVAALAADGRERWSASLDGPVQQLEVVDDRLVAVVGADGLFESHRVVALAADSGERRWEFAPEEWWLDVVGVHDGTVYASTSDDALGSTGQTLYAVSLADGTELWSGEVGDNAGGLVTDDAVYVTFSGRIYAYGHDGTQRWTRDVVESGSLVVAGDTVAFVGALDSGAYDGDRDAIGLSTADGSTRWSTGGWNVATLRSVGDRLVAGGDSLVEIDPATGETGWRFDGGGYVAGAPVADGTLIAGGASVHAVAVADGTKRWRYESEFRAVEPVAVVGGTVYALAATDEDDWNRYLVALDAGSGAERWRVTAESRFTGPVVLDGRLVAGSEAGVVYGFE